MISRTSSPLSKTSSLTKSGFELSDLPILISFSVIAATALALVYEKVQGVSDLSLWESSLLVNGVLALIYLRWASGRILKPTFGLRQALAIFPSLALVVATYFALHGISVTVALDPQEVYSTLLMVLVVPVAEELCFRGALTSMMKWLVGGRSFLASYFSAVVFAFLHSHPTFSGSLVLGIPFGPLVLGLCCEALAYATGNLFASVCLHGICNAVVAALAWWAPELLQWIARVF